MIFRDVVREKKVLIYVYEFLALAKDRKSGFERLKGQLHTAELYVRFNWKKCKFLQREMEFLGHVKNDTNKTVRPPLGRYQQPSNFQHRLMLSSWKVF